MSTLDDYINDINTGDTAWMLTATALVLFMTPGVGFFYGGAVGHLNVIATMFQSFVTMGLVTMTWVWLGFSLTYGDDIWGVIGSPFTYYFHSNVGAHPDENLAVGIPLTVFSMYEGMFAMTACSVVSGALAERIDFHAWMIYVVLWTLFVFCPLAHTVWHPQGYLHEMGYLDFAGAIPCEVSAGFSALAAAAYMGPRKVVNVDKANVPFIMLGTAIFWFGWIGFNAGGARAADGLSGLILLNTNTAGASGMITWIGIDIFMKKPNSSVGACNGLIVGLAAITPACAYVTVPAAMCIGILTTIICYFVNQFMREVDVVDDALDVFSIHGLGGVCGALFTGIFCHLNPYGECSDIFIQSYAILITVPYIVIVAYLLCFVADCITPLRVSDLAEKIGLDLAYHDESVHSTATLQLLNRSMESQLYGTIGSVLQRRISFTHTPTVLDLTSVSSSEYKALPREMERWATRSDMSRDSEARERWTIESDENESREADANKKGDTIPFTNSRKQNYEDDEEYDGIEILIGS